MHPWHLAPKRRPQRGCRATSGTGPQRFDVLPLSVATDGGAAAVGVDRRRFRANAYLEGVEGLAERDWPGFALLGHRMLPRAAAAEG